MAYNLVDTVEKLESLVESIQHDVTEEQLIFLNFEGVDLGRHGSIAVVEILLPPDSQVHLLDVHTLGNVAFEHEPSGGRSLSTVLKSEKYAKVFFDARNVSDALFHRHDITLAGVLEVQMLEYVTRDNRGGLLHGLAKCIAGSRKIDHAEKQRLEAVKKAGRALFRPEQGGRYEVFLDRPLTRAILEYCVTDILALPKLLGEYGEKLGVSSASKIHNETLRRITAARKPTFVGKGIHMAAGPSHILGGPVTSTEMAFPTNLAVSAKLGALCCLVDGDKSSTQGEEPQGTSIFPGLSFDMEEFFQSDTFTAVKRMAAYEKRRLRRNNRVRADRHLDPVVDNNSLSEGGIAGANPETSKLDVADAADSDGSEPQEEQESVEFGFGDESNWSDFDNDSSKDYAACSLEDCGYCGHCMY